MKRPRGPPGERGIARGVPTDRLGILKKLGNNRGAVPMAR